MTADALALAAAAALFAAFGVGWAAHWIWRLFGRIASPQEDRIDELLAEIEALTTARDEAVAERETTIEAIGADRANRESELIRRLAEITAERDAAMDALGGARREIADLQRSGA